MRDTITSKNNQPIIFVETIVKAALRFREKIFYAIVDRQGNLAGKEQRA